LKRLAMAAPNWQPPPDEKPVEAEGDGIHFPCTDSGNSELVASINAGRIRYDHRRGLWLRWGSHFWEHDSDGELFRLAKEAARARYKRAASIEDLDQRKAEAKWAISSESRQRIDAALALARSERTLADSGDNWNIDPFLLAVKNGVVDLRTGKLRPGRPEDRINIHAGIDYIPEAACPRWLTFLEEVFEGNRELIDFIYRSAGYGASGDTREQVLFVCHGSGSNGKGSFLNSIRKALGDYGHNIPFQTLEMQDRGGIPNDLAGLVARRFVTASETNQTSRLNEARIKALTGCDPISARFMRGEWFTFEPAAKFWLAVNHKPRVRDDSPGFWRRVRLIPFTRQFTGDKADLHLDEKLNAELPGILWWIVCGCLSWQEQGLNPPAIVTAATEEYRQESDLLSEFVTERCVIGPLFTAGGSELFKVYRIWAEARGMREREIMGSTDFGTRMTERFNKRRLTSGVIYEGIGLSM
jgi:putative DNA primase/helicase